MMRNAETLGVCQNRLDAIRRNFKLFRDFVDAHAVVEVIDKYRATQERRFAVPA
jgi:hypothetical protein